MEPLKGGRLAKNLPPEMQAVFDARTESWSPAEWALRYVLNEPGVSLLLSGMNDAAQLEENLRSRRGRRARARWLPEHLAVYAAARAAMRVADEGRLQRLPLLPALSARRGDSRSSSRPSMPHRYGIRRIQWLTGYTRIHGKGEACTECGQVRGDVPAGTSDTRAFKAGRRCLRLIAHGYGC
jgi:hypothetical protein